MYRRRLLVLPFLIALVGCTRSSHDDRQTSPRAPAAPRGRIHLGTIDERELARRIQRQRGKVVLVDFWATWCGPCLELLPHTAALARRFGDRGLAVIAVDFDDEQKRADVVEILASRGASFETYMSQYGGAADSVERFQIEDSTLPNLKLYDRRGRLVRTFSGVTDAAEIDRAVEATLGESAAGGTENWPCWRGPRGDGSSREKDVPRKWDGPKGEQIAWKVEAGLLPLRRRDLDGGPAGD